MKVSLSDKLLLSVQKPVRYIGGEVNSIYKATEEYDVHYCFCFPDVYDVGMCHLGLQILYYEINKPDHVYCGRIWKKKCGKTKFRCFRWRPGLR